MTRRCRRVMARHVNQCRYRISLTSFLLWLTVTTGPRFQVPEERPVNLAHLGRRKGCEGSRARDFLRAIVLGLLCQLVANRQVRCDQFPPENDGHRQSQRSGDEHRRQRRVRVRSHDARARAARAAGGTDVTAAGRYGRSIVSRLCRERAAQRHAGRPTVELRGGEGSSKWLSGRRPRPSPARHRLPAGHASLRAAALRAASVPAAA